MQTIVKLMETDKLLLREKTKEQLQIVSKHYL